MLCWFSYIENRTCVSFNCTICDAQIYAAKLKNTTLCPDDTFVNAISTVEPFSCNHPRACEI